jgi:hypothetical protein
MVKSQPETECDLMSEAKAVFFEPTFNRAVKVRSRDERLTSNAGALLLREVDHKLGLMESLACEMKDPRRQEWIRYPLTELLRERIYALAFGQTPADDVDLLAHDPAMRVAVWDQPGERVLQERLASQPTHSRLLDILANFPENLETLRYGLADWVGRHLRATGRDRAVVRGTVDVDSFDVVVYGQQEGAEHNGYYGEKVYHPLVASFSPGGDYDSRRLGDGFVHAMLRKGAVTSPDGAVEFVREVQEKCSGLARTIDFRMDAAFAIGEVMDDLSDGGVRFVSRLRKNPVIEKLAQPHLKRPAGRPPAEGYEFTVELGRYRAEPWKHEQRLLLVVVDQPDPKTGQLELFPDYFFLVTSWKEEEKSSQDLLEHYRRRGTFEDRLGELRACTAAHLSSPRFDENEATLLLCLLAFNLVAMLRGELEEATENGWDLARVQRSVLKAGARVNTSARRIFIDVARAAVIAWQLLIRGIEQWKPSALWELPKGPRPRTWMPPPKHAHLHLVLRL